MFDFFKFNFDFNFSFRFKSRLKFRKGIIALDATIGVILSVLALFLVFQLFSNIFFQDSSNLLIVKNNIEGIKNFVVLGNDNLEFKSISNCFLKLRLKNLEIFQKEEDDNSNYVIIISSNGISYLSFDKMKSLIESNFKDFNLNSLNLVVDFRKDKVLGKKVEIALDDTISPSIFDDYIFRSSDSFVKYKILSNGIIVLKPNFDKVDVTLENGLKHPFYLNLYDVEIYDLNLNSNKLVAEYDDLDVSYFLNYNVEKNYLIVNKDYYSNILINDNLCVNKLFKNKDWEEYYDGVPVEDWNFMNYEIDLSCVPEGDEPLSGDFKWKNGVVCNDESGNNLCNNIDSSMSYEDFVKTFRTNCLGLNLNKNIDFKYSRKELLKDEIVKYDNIYFDDIFQVFEDNYVFNGKEYNIIVWYLLGKKDHYDSYNEEAYNVYYENHVYDNSNFLGFFNDGFNNCEDDICNKIIILNDEAYFYIKGFNSEISSRMSAIRFYKFKNPDYLRLGEDGELYFNKNKLEKIKLEVSKDCSMGIMCKSMDFYKFKVDDILVDDNVKKSFDVILTMNQYNSIREFKLKSGGVIN